MMLASLLRTDSPIRVGWLALVFLLTLPSWAKDHLIEFPSSLDGQALHGTLSVPDGDKPRGVILFLAGSGKVDRYATMPAERTATGRKEQLFSQLADPLLERGYATLRYDKRGVLGPDGQVDDAVWLTADRQHLTADAASAASFLLDRFQLPPSELIIVGHSEGTILAVETALGLGGKVRGLALLGVVGRSMEQILRYQVVENPGPDNTKTAAELEAVLLKVRQTIADPSQTLAPDGKPTAWYRQHLAAPANSERLLGVRAHVAVFQGELDSSTPMVEVDSLLEAGNRGLHVYRYPGLGHGFAPEREGRQTLGPIQPHVIADFLTEIEHMTTEFSPGPR